VSLPRLFSRPLPTLDDFDSTEEQFVLRDNPFWTHSFTTRNVTAIAQGHNLRPLDQVLPRRLLIDSSDLDDIVNTHGIAVVDIRDRELLGSVCSSRWVVTRRGCYNRTEVTEFIYHYPEEALKFVRATRCAITSQSCGHVAMSEPEDYLAKQLGEQIRPHSVSTTTSHKF
jgi:hypothetical protein